MPEEISLTFRIVTVAIFAFLFSQIFFLLGDKIWNFEVISQLFDRWYAVLGYFVGLVLEAALTATAAFTSSYIISFLGLPIPPQNVFTSNLRFFLRGLWAYPTQLPPGLTLPQNIADLIGGSSPLAALLSPILYMLQPLYFSFYPLLFVIAISGIFFYLVLGEPRAGQVAFAALVGVVVVASFHFPPLATRSISIGFSIPSADITTFLVSQTFFLGLVSYLYLESLYMTDYIRQIRDPQQNRKQWLEAQIKIIQKEASKARELTAEESTIRSTKIGKSMSSTAFTFIRENLEKRLFKRLKKEDTLVIHDVRRLEAYLRELNRKNPDAIETLKAESGVATTSEIIKPVTSGVIIRLVIISIMSFVVMQPTLVLQFLNMPTVIFESLEATTPEMSLFILLPVALLFPVISQVIKYGIERTKRLREDAFQKKEIDEPPKIEDVRLTKQPPKREEPEESPEISE
ncbi:MAG: hypothetical protein ACXACA_03400 [Candidatus Ranarchaeia archaeon]|jgi:hypothetical protein